MVWEGEEVEMGEGVIEEGGDEVGGEDCEGRCDGVGECEG